MNKTNAKQLRPLWEETVLRSYLGEVKRRHGYVETVALPNLRDLSPLRIESIFVQPQISEKHISPELAFDLWPEGMSLITALESSPCLVLLGDPGSGKTTLSNWLAWRLSAGLRAQLPVGLDDCLPIPCVLRDLTSAAFSANNVADIATIIAEKVLGDRYSQGVEEEIRLRVAAGKYALILDGIDEIPVVQRSIIATWIRQASANGAFVLATARIVGYEDYPVDKALPVEIDKTRRSSANADFHAFDTSTTGVRKDGKGWAEVRFLMPFDDKRISAFVDNWYQQRCGGTLDAKEKANDLLEALSKSEQMQNLARTPNLLSLMAIVHRERANLPDGKALLYKEISNAYINTIDQQRKIAKDDPLAKFSWETREGWLAYVGFKMQLKRQSKSDELTSAGVLVTKSDVTKWLSEAMTVSQVADADVRSGEFLEWVARRSGLLIPRGDELYAFVHLSFQEYFCARYLCSQVMSRSFIRNIDTPNANVTREKLADWAEESLWRESLVFFFEIISAEHGSDWVNEYLEIVFDGHEDLDNSRATLGARILADQHIHFDLMLRNSLASRSAREGFDEWRFFASRPEREILKHLVKSKYAAVVFAGEETLPEIAADVVEKGAAALRESASSINVLVAYGKNFLDTNVPPKLEQLRFATFSNTSITDLSPLKYSKALEIIEIRRSPIQNITILAGCTELTEIDISVTQVRDISSLTHLRRLNALHLSDTAIEDLNPLKSMNLQMLSVDGLEIYTIPEISKMRNLFYINLDRTQISDISPLVKNRILIGVSLSGTPVEDLSPLVKLKNLTRLDLEVCHSQNPTVIGKLKGLRTLRFGSENSVDFSFLRKLRNLESLTLAGNFTGDLSIFEELPRLRDLEFVSSNISKQVIVRLNLNLERLILNGESVNLANLSNRKK